MASVMPSPPSSPSLFGENIPGENLDIKTKSIEKTLIPLVNQITTLVNAKEKPIKSAKTVRAIVEVGAAVNVAVERFVSVGQAIADDSLDIKTDMYAACNDARAAGAAIQRLTEIQMDKSGNATMASTCKDKKSMVRAARALLSSATKVLLLADTVVVKQLLSAKEKVSISLNRLENVANFTEFVKAFGLFGSEMVELAHLTGDRQNDLKDEKRRAQMTSARQILERSTMMLLTASKTCLRHPDCETARENRDTVFCQMRRAMDMIHYVVKDGVIPDLAPSSDASTPTSNSAMSNGNKTSSSRSKRSSNFAAAAAVVGISSGYDDLDNNFTVHNTIKRFEDIVEMTRMTLVGAGYREKLTSALEKVVECTQDFTDSAYTSHEHRQSILMLCDRTNFQLNHLLNVDSSTANMEQQEMNSPSEELETAIVSMLNATYDLRKELQDTALEQVEDIQNLCHDQQVLYSLRNSSLSGDAARLEECSERFLEQAEHLHEVCKLIWHIAQGSRSQVSAKHTETSIRIYGPQIISAGKTVCMFPNSKIAKENLNVFIDVWTTLLRDMNGVVKEVLDHHYNQHHGSHSPHYQTQVHHQQQQHHHHHHHHRHYQQQQQQLHQDQHLESEKFASQSRQQKHSSTGKSKPVKLDCEEQAKIAKLGLEMKLLTSEIDAETEKWEESENNDIVKKAKNMSAMAFTMYQFTKGEGMLKTTQDLFTQAEYFAEDANKLYKLVRQFSYQVPASGQKSSLLEYLDKVPTYVQQLQYTVKNPTVGKAATFTKVDNVIQETKNLMNVISKVVSTCFICATKYNLEFQGCSGGSGGGGGSSGRSSQNMSPLNRMDSMDESNDASRLNDSYGNNSTGSGATSLSKMSNGQSAANPNI